MTDDSEPPAGVLFFELDRASTVHYQKYHVIRLRFKENFASEPVRGNLFALAAGGLSASTGQLLVLANPNSNTLKVPAGTKNLVFIGGEGANPDKYAVIN